MWMSWLSHVKSFELFDLFAKHFFPIFSVTVEVKRIDFLKDTRELLRWRRAAEDGLQGRAAFRTGTGRVLKDEELHQVAGSMAEKMRTGHWPKRYPSIRIL